MAEESNEYIYAGFWRRYAAVFLDGIICFGIFWLALGGVVAPLSFLSTKTSFPTLSWFVITT